MPPSVRQTNFSGGELSPLLWGRTDLPLFARGLRTCRNFFISKHGAAVSRPGTTYVATLKHVNPFDALGLPDDPNVTLKDVGRLVRFVAGADSSFALLFGQNYIRFYTQGEVVLDGGGNPYEVVTPYTVDDIWALKFAQTGDVLTIVSPSFDARELKHLDTAHWTLGVVDFAPLQPYFFDVGGSPDAPTTAFVAERPLATADTDHPAREWQWQVTMLVRDKATGAVFETLPELVSESYDPTSTYDISVHPLFTDVVPIYPDKLRALSRSDTEGLISQPDGWDSYDVIAFNFYRGRGGLFGFIGQTATRQFIDVGDAPDYGTQPPIGTLPYGTALEANGEHKDRPVTVAFFQERRVFGGSVLRPETIHASKTGDYNNFDERVLIHMAGEALDVTLASRTREDIRALVTRQRLLIFTGSGVWSLGGSQGSPMDFDDIDARVEDETGATHLPPIVADGVVLYARAKGVGVRALISDGQQYSYKGTDVSVASQHLFLGVDRTLVDWCYAQDPWGVVWAVRADGALLSLTHDGDNAAWARHDTDGSVESICSVPEGDEDAVYLVVKRTINGVNRRFVERMSSRVRRYRDTDPNPRWPQLYPGGICLDAALEYEGVPVDNFTGLGALEGKQVWVVARKQDPRGPYLVVGGTLVEPSTGKPAVVYDPLPEANYVTAIGLQVFVAHVGLAFTPQLETLDIASGEARLRKKTVERIGFETDQAIGLSVGQDLDHLEEWVQRDVDADGFNAVSAATVLVDMPVASNIDQSARAALQQSMPLPVTVVGLTRELSIGD